ncbi:MAG: tetratricopeptide repeat protein [Gemmatimonadales bacterium]
MRARVAMSLLLLGAACATPGQVRRVETQVSVLERTQARADSARAAELTRIIAMQQRGMDSLVALSSALGRSGRDNMAEFTEIRRSLLVLQELSGQSQRRLSDLRNQLEVRGAETPAPVPASTDSTRSSAGQAPINQPSADAIYSAARGQSQQGAMMSARLGFRRLLELYPTSPLAADATYGLADTFDPAQPDSARVYYSEVISKYATSARAPTALFKLGKLSERRADRAAAKAYYQQVIDRYPQSDEAKLARDALRALP